MSEPTAAANIGWSAVAARALATVAGVFQVVFPAVGQADRFHGDDQRSRRGDQSSSS